MDRRANHNSRRGVWMVMLAVAGALWNCGTVTGAVGNVFPVDGSVIPGTVYTPTGNIYTFLDARADPNAVSYVCYFSHIEAEVTGRVEDANIGPQLSSVPNLRWIVGLPDDVHPGDPYPDGLVGGTKYYWAVDAFDALDNKFDGDVWEFTVRSHSYYATNPDPHNEAVGVDIPVLLCWQSGLEVDFHVIYFSTSFDDVNDGPYIPMDIPPWPWTQPGDDEDWDPVADGGLTIEFGTTYYWRIDEVHVGPLPGSGKIYKGDVWSFTTEEKRIYVDINANGANNGTSWEDAYNYLQDALADANSSVKPVEVRVAEGIYTPDSNSADPNGSGDRTATFKLINGVTLKGGYAGFGEPDPYARDIELYETILSGDLYGDDGPDFANNGENSYHVVSGSGTDANTVLDGFTITAGNANGLWPKNTGGGIHRCNAKVYNCIISWNWAEKYGGGMYNQNYPGESIPIIENCAFSNNSAGHRGGGMYNDYCSSPPRLNNCKFTKNSAILGGGMCNYESNTVLTNCIFGGNSASQKGGGMFSDTTPCHVVLINCTFSHNSAGQYGGATYWGDESEPQLVNSIFYENTAAEGSQIAVDTPYYYSLSVSYCNIQGGKTDIYGYYSSNVEWSAGNIDADPCFADAYNGDYHLKSEAGRWDANSESWVVDDVTSPCVDAGNPGCPVGDEPLPNGNRRNMGAYGGTAEASKSPANWRSIADMTNDRVVDSNDLKVFADYWLESGECIPSDFDRSQFVDFDDFAIFGLHWSYPSTEPGMTFHVGDCTMEAGQKWTAAAEPNGPRFSVWVEGRYIYFEDSMYANCCPDELGLDKEVNGNEITLYEIGYGGLCNCMCYFPITATLGPFENGTYTIEVFDNYGTSLGIIEVTIGGSPGPGITYRIDGCDMFSRTEQSSQTRFSVTVAGLYIHFEDKMTANCCPDELELEMTVEDNLITIYENEYTSEGCRCMCSFPITATLGPFESGIYTLEVYETMGGFIGSTTVVIEPPQ